MWFHPVLRKSRTALFCSCKKVLCDGPQVWFVSIFPTSVHSCSRRRRNAVLLYKETSFICTKLPPRFCGDQKALNVMAVRAQGKTSETSFFLLVVQYTTSISWHWCSPPFPKVAKTHLQRYSGTVSPQINHKQTRLHAHSHECLS